MDDVGIARVSAGRSCCSSRCAARLRLARFNTETSHEIPSYAAPFFTGAPAPAGAGLVMVPMFLSFEWGDWLFRSPYLNAVTVTGIALLMISKVPTVSLKRIRIPHHMVIPTLLAFGVATAFLTTEPWLTLTVVGIVYVGSIPLTIRSYYRLKRAAEARKAESRREARTPFRSPAPARFRSATQPGRRTNGGIEELAQHCADGSEVASPGCRVWIAPRLVRIFTRGKCALLLRHSRNVD